MINLYWEPSKNDDNGDARAEVLNQPGDGCCELSSGTKQLNSHLSKNWNLEIGFQTPHHLFID